jgi:Caspase domain
MPAMTLRALALLAVLGAVLPSSAAGAAGTLQRFALVVGANDGGADRAPLRYAVSDAEHFARVLVDLGGVSPAHEIFLRQPRLGELEAALERLRSEVLEARRAASSGRTEILVYYSGHADEKGLLLGEDRYSYRSLRDRLEAVPADVRIAVLDACASGAITHLKGGRLRPPFLVDEAADMRGHAFLTSSAETETAQESDRIGASYFTHYLISGLRGAADVSGEGKVTLNEAYQFAFNETLGHTVDTRGGAQHPSYDINLSGTGDVVITDLRQTSATLVLGEALDGRFFVRNGRQELVVELYKPYGRKVELGLEPGRYEVRVERGETTLVAKPEVATGAPVVLEPDRFQPTRPEAARARGRRETPRFAVAGRNRIELRLGIWRSGTSASRSTGVVTGTDASDLFTGLGYARYINEKLALTVDIDARRLGAGTTASPGGVSAGSRTASTLLFGIRWNPSQGDVSRRAVRPYLATSLGPMIGWRSGSTIGADGVSTGRRTIATVAGHVGGGLDLHLSRSWSVGLFAGFNWMTDFADPIASTDNFSGLQVGLNVGWLFGRGTHRRP